jgi:hypothetical protein
MDMTPVYVSLGDHHNVYAFRNIMHTGGDYDPDAPLHEVWFR